ncbi:MAG: hypothetical protein JW891_11620 [Candidatus Lokiarchaeota archaeon]|nr:hypothetical protein [Candidatus Lokiarchaeota archaeon]
MSDEQIDNMILLKHQNLTCQKYKKNQPRKDSYNKLKSYNNSTYSGMTIGHSHNWNYNNGKWHETKLSPNQWSFSFNSLKSRMHIAPFNSGANVQTKYHWYIIADQIATKLDANSYMTEMNGVKFKIGHKRPHWKTFSYNYLEQDSYKKQVIKILEETLRRLKE